MNKHLINVAIDGTSSSGKSTMAKALAKYAGYTYIDTGAMYRSVALFCLQHGIVADGIVNKAALISQLPNINITFKINPEGVQETYLNGVNVEKQIRGLEVSSNVSIVAAIPEVRHAMVAQQQQMGSQKGVVMDGRDIGTTVLPNAEIKIFVSTSAEERAQRRFKEMQEKGDNTVTYEEILANVKERDHLDMTREESPLRQAHDAYALDSTQFHSAEAQIEWLINYFNAYIDAHFKE